MKLFNLCILTLCLAFFSCKDSNLFSFTFENRAAIVVPAATGVNLPINIATPDVQSNSSQQFASNKTRAELVKEVKLTELELTIQEPSNKTFSFLRSVSISISAEGLPTKEIAYITDIPTSVGNSILLTTTNEKLDAYIKKDKYSISTSVITRESFFQDVRMEARMKFRVSADLL